MTSQQTVTKVKRLFRAKKAGHTGTLDPLATGVLLVCLGEATKVSRFLLSMDKKYTARVKLGERTDTQDSQGRIIEKKDAAGVTKEALQDAVSAFAGRIMQKPPMYSAIKIGGEVLYKLARKGIEIERPERSVEIHDIRILKVDFPYFELAVSCSKGTYIRTLCEDIGLKLGTGAHLVSLERTGIGFFDIHDAATFDDLMSLQVSVPSSHGKKSSPPCQENFSHIKEIKTGDIEPGTKYIISIDTALKELREIVLDEENFRRASHGMQIISNEIKEIADNEFVRLKDPARNLFAIGRLNSKVIRVERILKL